MNTLYLEKVRAGREKIIKCYESCYKDYFEDPNDESFEQFKLRLKVVRRMIENWENLTKHYINLSHKSYKAEDSFDIRDREIELYNWKYIIYEDLASIASRKLYQVVKNRVNSICSDQDI